MTGQTFKLKPGCYAEYKKAHDELWPGIAEGLRTHGVSMVIHHFEDRLYLFATAPSQRHFEQSQEGAEVDRWSEYMATLMITDGEGRSIVEEMDLAFTFGDFAAGEGR